MLAGLADVPWAFADDVLEREQITSASMRCLIEHSNAWTIQSANQALGLGARSASSQQRMSQPAAFIDEKWRRAKKAPANLLAAAQGLLAAATRECIPKYSRSQTP
jgi:hypothetical protein